MRTPAEVYFKLQAQNNSWYYAIYQDFRVDPEANNYMLHFNDTSYVGTAGS